jgi:hypothetical protein
MVPSLRKEFNAAFTDEKYQEFLHALNAKHPGAIEFRIAETPVFIPNMFGQQMEDACESIIDLIVDPAFQKLTDRSVPKTDFVPDENRHTHFIAFDFGICRNEQGGLEPQLIEMQGFPTLYGFQVYYPDLLREYFAIPDNYSQYLGGHNRASYLADLKEVILAGEQPEHVILLEIKPHQQKTRIDFYCTQDYLGIEPVCITDLIQEGKDLFYINTKTGKKTPVKRIYNRVIFDDLHAQAAMLGKFTDIRQSFNVQWVPHPNWFYRISKFTLPFIRHPFVPPTFFLNEVNHLPEDLSQYVLKPLYSFAGQGVVIDLTQADLDKVKDPENWILQKKVNYADVIETPAEPAKAEIRMMYLWKENEARPKLATNLARLSKGKMIGVRYNKDKLWVGGSVAYFEK